MSHESHNIIRLHFTFISFMQNLCYIGYIFLCFQQRTTQIYFHVGKFRVLTIIMEIFHDILYPKEFFAGNNMKRLHANRLISCQTNSFQIERRCIIIPTFCRATGHTNLRSERKINIHVRELTSKLRFHIIESRLRRIPRTTKSH